jgi:hypothetical protein
MQEWMAKITIQTTEVESPITNTSIYEIEDVPLNETELKNLIGFAIEARDKPFEPKEESKEELILPKDK